ncbi:MAG: hypothetical protein K8F91_08770 [Candidatus Obscuribacterales bacterium]|nr:hypothetical protein [Candidatus Obscuribacterales bacterium]
MLKVVVYTVSGTPSFLVDKTLTPALIRKAVSSRFGYQGIHLPHTWVAFLTD